MREHPPIVLTNPFNHLELPRIEPRPVEFLEHEEAEVLYTAAEGLGSRWRTLIELGTRSTSCLSMPAQRGHDGRP
jgi:hypothetical protein